MKCTVVALLFGIPYALFSAFIKGHSVYELVLPFLGVLIVGLVADLVAFLWRKRSNIMRG